MDLENISENPEHQAIKLQLAEMAGIDQDMRGGDVWDATIDQANTEVMKNIIAEIGWPSISKVGRASSENAWLLVQHADHDVAFQKECLQLMKEIPLYDIEPDNITYLEDRVRVNEGRGQLYGTQFRQIDNQHVPCEIEDENEVDARRAAMGMGPLSEQIDLMNTQYPLDTEK